MENVPHDLWRNIAIGVPELLKLSRNSKNLRKTNIYKPICSRTPWLPPLKLLLKPILKQVNRPDLALQKGHMSDGKNLVRAGRTKFKFCEKPLCHKDLGQNLTAENPCDIMV